MVQRQWRIPCRPVHTPRYLLYDYSALTTNTTRHSRDSRWYARIVALPPVLLASCVFVADAMASSPELDALNISVEALIDAVARGDTSQKRALAGRIVEQLDQVDQRIRRTSRLVLETGKNRAIVKVLTDTLSTEEVARTFEGQTNLADRLRALKHNYVGFMVLQSPLKRRFLLHYYPPMGVFVARTEPTITRGVLSDGAPDTSVMDARRQIMESLWDRSVEIRLALSPHAARLLGIDAAHMSVRYADLGLIETRQEPSRSREALVSEIQRQLEYVCNVKLEGPPLLKVLKSNLVFDGIFGFSGWGGRWPEFGNVIFNFHYDPMRDQFLITLRRMP